MPTQACIQASINHAAFTRSTDTAASNQPGWPSPGGPESILQSPHDASQWLFRAADEALLAFVKQKTPRQHSLTTQARMQLDTLSDSQLQSVADIVQNYPHDWYDWNALQPATLSAFSSASLALMEARSTVRDSQATTPETPETPETPPNLAESKQEKRKKRSKRAKKPIETPSAVIEPTNAPFKDLLSLDTQTKRHSATGAPHQADNPGDAHDQALDPQSIIERFLALQPESGNESQRRRAIHKTLLQTGTAEIGILVSRSNLHVRGFNPLPNGKSRQRSLLMVPEVFCRLTERLGPINTMVVKDMLETTQTLALPASDARAFHFRMTLVCGLFGLLHRLHMHRIANGQKSNWPEHGQGLLHFNFMHIITGLGEIPELAIMLQDAFCECLLDAGKRLPEDANLQTVWGSSETIKRRTGERIRQLARNPEFLSVALASEDNFGLLVSTLSIVLAHAKLIQTDPLRRQLAASILETFATTLLTELSPFVPRSVPTK